MAQNCLLDGSDAPPPAGVSTLQWNAIIAQNRQELEDSLLARVLQDINDDDCKIIIRLEQRASEEGAGSREDSDEHGCNTHLSLTHTHAPGVSISPRDKPGKHANKFCVAPFFFAPLQSRLLLLLRRTSRS